MFRDTTGKYRALYDVGYGRFSEDSLRSSNYAKLKKSAVVRVLGKTRDSYDTYLTSYPYLWAWLNFQQQPKHH